MNGSVILSAVSTGVIAFFSIASFFLARNIKAKNNEYQKQVSDLFQAITISNMLSGPKGFGSTDLENRITFFNQLYEGDIQIFPTGNIYAPRR